MYLFNLIQIQIQFPSPLHLHVRMENYYIKLLVFQVKGEQEMHPTLFSLFCCISTACLWISLFWWIFTFSTRKDLATTFFGKVIIFITEQTYITKHSITTGFLSVNFPILPKCFRCLMLLTILFTFFFGGSLAPDIYFHIVMNRGSE